MLLHINELKRKLHKTKLFKRFSTNVSDKNLKKVLIGEGMIEMIIEGSKPILIDGEETNYVVTKCGRVVNIATHKPLKQCKNKDGYLHVNLQHKGKGKTFTVHRLVAIAFIPNPNNLPQINHKDENKQNNCVENLEWCTNEYNVNYGTRTERALETRRKKRESFVKNT